MCVKALPSRARPIVGQLALETQLDPCEVDNFPDGDCLDDVWHEAPWAKRCSVGACKILDVVAAIVMKEAGM